MSSNSLEIAFVIILLSLPTPVSHCSDSLTVVITLRSQYGSQHFGESMAGVGDVNGDLLADFVVADPYRNEVYLYLGRSRPDSVPDVTISAPEWHPECPYSSFGSLVSGGHDANGDSFDDIVVTNRLWYWETGKFYLYYGGPSFDTEPDVAIAGAGSSWMTQFWATALRAQLLGDVNRDGYDDIVCLVSFSADAGAYLYFGGAPMDSTHDLSLIGNEHGIVLGSCAGGGDLNGDGCGDLTIGCDSGDPSMADAAWIFWGGDSMDDIPDVRLRPEGAPYCAHISTPGDLNGDDFEDVMLTTAGGPDQDGYPRAFAFFGGVPMDSMPGLSFKGEYYHGPVFTHTGGDLDLDGFCDAIISQVACEEDEGQFGVHLGSVTMDTVPEIVVWGEGSFGEAVSWIGDMTGDGWAEFAVSNPSGAGEIYIYTMGEVSGDGPRPSALHGGELRIVPNPSNGMTMIRFDVDEGAEDEVRIYDLAGHLIRRLEPFLQEVEPHWVLWDGRSSSGDALPGGTYVVRVQSGNEAFAKRIVVAR